MSEMSPYSAFPLCNASASQIDREFDQTTKKHLHFPSDGPSYFFPSNLTTSTTHT